MSKGVYPPSEDTFLLLDVINKERQNYSIAVEIGTGSGIIAQGLSKISNYVIATDISKEAIKRAYERVRKQKLQEKVDFVLGDLLTFFKREAVLDLIVFNPPYIPERRRIADVTWYGGISGREVIDKFLSQIKECRVKKCLLVQSTLSDLEKTIKTFDGSTFKVEIKGELRGFFERIVVLEITNTYRVI